MSKTNLQRSTAEMVVPMSVPRHQNLARTLAREIETGVYPVGSKLPRELDLCAQFGASRHTVRTALNSLVRMGLIKRTPRLGTTVVSDKVRQGYQLKVGQISDLMQFSHDTRMKVLSCDLQTVDAKSEEALRQYEGQIWLHVRGLRHSNEHTLPISYHEVWVHPDYRGVDGIEGVINQPIFEYIEQQFGVSAVRVRQAINSAAATPAVSKHLEIERDTPCLWVRREYYDAHGRMVELSLSVHPGDIFTYEMELERH